MQLALYVSHHLHLGRLRWAAADLEWDPQLLAFRARLEEKFLASVRADAERVLQRVGRSGSLPFSASAREVVDLIYRLIETDSSPSVSRYLEHHGTIAHYSEAVTARAAYQLMEGDFHTFAIPRLSGRAKQILVAIQVGEYGADAPGQELHASLFARTMRELGLNDQPYALINRQGASALAVSNLISTLALRASLIGALVGHLAVFEMTSVEPMARSAAGLRRLGASDGTCRFYDVHVLADSEHEHMAAAMVEALVEDDPTLANDVAFGAAAAIAVEGRYARALLGRWAAQAELIVETAAV